MREDQKKIQEHLMPTYNRFPITFDYGDGAELYDTDGNRYIDFVGGIAVNSLGYNDPGVKEAINEQLNKLQHISNLYYTEPLGEAADLLSSVTGMDEVFFTNSGTEAVECALKLARRHASLNKSPEANEIISMNGSFHGRTYGSVTATAQPQYHEHFGPMVPGFLYSEFNDIEDIKNLIGEKTAAVIIEPIKGEGGIISASEEYLKELRKICDETNTLLIFDEVQCGAGRTGKFLACDYYEIKPDILVMAKGIGAGFPVGACLATREVGESLSAGSHGTTYGGNPLACAIVSHVVSRIADADFLESVQDRGNYFKSRLEELKEKYPEYIADVRGKGLILGIELSIPVAEVIDEGIKNGLLTVSAAGNTIRFVPPLIISKDLIDEGIDILDQAIQTVGKKEK